LFSGCNRGDSTPYEYTSKYFEYFLVTDCGQTTFDKVKKEFDQNDLQWTIPKNITSDANLNYCDYYQAGFGYEFTFFD
jgi:hypothetical protein